jgi:hypothetical protein
MGLSIYVEMGEMLDGGCPFEANDLTKDQWRAVGIVRKEQESAAWRTRLNSLLAPTTRPPKR